MKKAIIFDMDGVIAMTSSIQSGAESEVFAAHGIHISSEEILKRYSGFKDIDMFKDVLKRKKSNFNPHKLWEEKWKKVYEKIEKENIPVVSGVIDFINNLITAGFILSVASATNLKFIQIVLNKIDILKTFKIITSGDEVKTGKPNPEIFLITAQKLKIDPRNCVVIEDAPHGVTAAKKAGMKCIAITTTTTRENLKEADKIISSFSELSIQDMKNL